MPSSQNCDLASCPFVYNEANDKDIISYWISDNRKVKSSLDESMDRKGLMNFAVYVISFRKRSKYNARNTTSRSPSSNKENLLSLVREKERDVPQKDTRAKMRTYLSPVGGGTWS